jgi:hypothetical protein
MENYQSLYEHILSMPSIREAIQDDRVLLITLSGSRSIDVEHDESDYDVAIIFRDIKSKNLTLAPWGLYEGKKLNLLKGSYDELSKDTQYINWDLINFIIPSISDHEPIYKHPDYDTFDVKSLYERALTTTFDVMSRRFFETSPRAVNRFINEKRIYWLLALHLSKMKKMGETELEILRSYRQMSTDVKGNQEYLTEESILLLLSDIKNRINYYDSMTVAELKALASERDMSGYSSLLKADLIELHRDYDTEQRTLQEVGA